MKNYNKSFLLILHITSILLFFVITIKIGTFPNEKTIGFFILSLTITILYSMILKSTASLYNQQHSGQAYFLTIGSFLVAVFLQITTCVTTFYQ